MQNNFFFLASMLFPHSDLMHMNTLTSEIWLPDVSHTVDVPSNKDNLVEEANKLHEAADGDKFPCFAWKLKFNLQQQTIQLNFY